MPEQGFTANGRSALEHASQDARALGHGYVGTEHILLGILRVPGCAGVRALECAGAGSADIFSSIHSLFGMGDGRSRSGQGGGQQAPVKNPVRRTETRAWISTAATSRSWRRTGAWIQSWGAKTR